MKAERSRGVAAGALAHPVVRARALRKQFGRHAVVRGLDLEITAGQCFGFLGPNGAGKTTTLRMILGVSPLTSGMLEVFGMPVGKRGSEIRQRMGVVPQADNLDPDFSVAENLRVYASYFGVPRALLRRRIQELLAFVELAERADDKTEQLSGGMKRRLAFVRALINDPELIVLDEPTTGLDPQVRHLLWTRIRQLASRGKTLLLCTHYMEEAERLCDRLVIMDQGRVLACGAPRELTRRYVEPQVLEIHDTPAELWRRLRASDRCRIEQVGDTTYCYATEVAPIIALLEDGAGSSYLHRPGNLEDVFLKLTGRELRE